MNLEKYTKFVRFFVGLVVSVALFSSSSTANSMNAEDIRIQDASPSHVINYSEPFTSYVTPEQQAMDDISLSSTASITVTLGAWRNTRPTESSLLDVSMLPPEYDVDCTSPDQKSEGWIVGAGGVILSYCNGVWDHIIIPQPQYTDIWGVQALQPDLSVATGAQGSIFVYLWDHLADDWVWTKSPIPIGNKTLYAVSMVPDGNDGYMGWAVGAKDDTGKGTLVKGTIIPVTIDGQPTYDYLWENETSFFPTLPDVEFYFDVHMLSPTNGWAVGGKEGEKGVFIHWDGTQWSVFQEIGTHDIRGIRMQSSDNGWAVGNAGVIYHYDGHIWSQVSSPANLILRDISYSPDGEAWIVGHKGTILRYSNGTWKPVPNARTDPFDFRAIDFTSGDGWLVGLNISKGIGGQILEYSDGAWYAVTPPTDNRLNDLSVINENDAWAVGVADELGGTIIHWDGKHWYRWFQQDLPIPAVDLYAIDMVSPTYGWAAGTPPTPNEPAIFLHWNGNRWSQPRQKSSINVQINDLDMLTEDMGWAVAIDGSAVARYDNLYNSWRSFATCGGVFYNLRGLSLNGSSLDWDGWAVGTSRVPATGEYFLHYETCAERRAWTAVQQPDACEDQTDGPSATQLHDIKMLPFHGGGSWGYAVGNYKDRGSIYFYSDEDGGEWDTEWCQVANSDWRPSGFNSVDVIEESGVAWFGGYNTPPDINRQTAWIRFKDADANDWAGFPFPLNGINIFHRPIQSIDMLSDTMGWAVGDVEGESDFSVIYQYPYPNFTLDISPASRAIIPGESTTFTVTVNSIGGFSADVTLQVGGIPEGISADINPLTINADSQAVITVSSTNITPLNVYDIPLIGSSIIRSGDNEIPVARQVTVRVTVTDNPIYNVSPLEGPSGTHVTINGYNFGSDPGVGNRSSGINHVILAGVQMPDASILSWSPTQITISVPDDALLFPNGPVIGVVSVLANSVQSNEDFNFQLENYISGISTESVDNSIHVSLTGTSFGQDPGVLLRSTIFEHVSFGTAWIANANILNWSNNLITFLVPKNADDELVTVTSNGYESNAVQFTNQMPNNNTYVYLPLTIRE